MVIEKIIHDRDPDWNYLLENIFIIENFSCIFRTFVKCGDKCLFSAEIMAV